MEASGIITMRDLRKRFGDVRAVDGVSFNGARLLWSNPIAHPAQSGGTHTLDLSPGAVSSGDRG